MTAPTVAESSGLSEASHLACETADIAACEERRKLMPGTEQVREELALAVDIGGTKVEAALVDRHGVIVPGSRFRRPTGRSASRGEITAAIQLVTRSAFEAATDGLIVVGLGVGSAGPIDRANTSVAPLNLPSAVDLSIRAAVGVVAPELPLNLALDGTCIALAEHWCGAARGASNTLAMVVSTGVGGGFILGGAAVVGNSGNAGHIGQILVRSRDDRDLVRGTLESIASGPASVAWAQRHGWAGQSGEDLASDYALADPVAVRAIRRSAEAVASAIVSASTLLDLEVVVLAGGFVSVAPDYVERVQHGVNAFALLEHARSTRVVASGLGGDGPLIGSARLVWLEREGHAM